MALVALRSILRPLSRTLISSSPSPLPLFTSPKSFLLSGSHFSVQPPQCLPLFSLLHSLTDTRFPKRRPSLKSRRKRAAMKPPGPYAWVKYVPGEPILPNRPNEGSVKRRNEKKRIKQHRAFILAEKKKRKAQLQEAKRRKEIKKVERKMAAVARERAWAERLAELKRIEEEKKASMA